MLLHDFNFGTGMLLPDFDWPVHFLFLELRLAFFIAGGELVCLK